MHLNCMRDESVWPTVYVHLCPVSSPLPAQTQHPDPPGSIHPASHVQDTRLASQVRAGGHIWPRSLGLWLGLLHCLLLTANLWFHLKNMEWVFFFLNFEIKVFFVELYKIIRKICYTIQKSLKCLYIFGN